MRRPFGTGLLLCALACRSGGGVRADSSASPVPGRVYTGSQVKPPPAVVWVPPLRYPDTLRAHGVEGRVLVDAIIDTGGRVEPASVAIVTSPDARFDAAARETVLGMRFLPGMVRNVPVRTSVRLPVQFRLRPDADTAELPLRLTQVEEQPELVGVSS